MIGWLIYHQKDIEKNIKYIEFYKKEGFLLNIQFQVLEVEKIRFGMKKNQWTFTYDNESIEFPDFIIQRSIYPLLSRQLEYMNIPTFNNSFVSEICNDKAKTYQYIGSLGINMIDTIFCKNIHLPSYLESVREKMVIKAVDGHGGEQVFLLDYEQCSEEEYQEQCKSLITHMNHSDVVIQPLVGTKHQDLRVYVIGNRIVASILRTAKSGFKSNFSLGGDVVAYELQKKEYDIVNRIVNVFDFGLVGIDFIIGDSGEFLFNEIEDVVGARMLYQCTNINLVRLYLEHIINKIS